MSDPVDRFVRAVSRRSSFVLVWAQLGLGHLIVLGGLGLLALYQPMSGGRFLVLTGVSQGLLLLDDLASGLLMLRMWRPVRAWEQDTTGTGQEGRSAHRARVVAAWRALATMPLEYVRRLWRFPFVLAYPPFIAFATWELGLSWPAGLLLGGVGTVVLAYELIVRYFALEAVLRPVLERVAEELPADFRIDVAGLPLSWRLLAAAPAINVITGVVVAGLSAHGAHPTLESLGLSWAIAVAVSFTISLELVVLVARSLVSSLRDLRRATERVAEGHLEARVPVVSADETGHVAHSFNGMVRGLQEREALREAFGAYVDPDVAARVLQEGARLPGQELEVTVMFLDVRGFTAFAERSDPTEVVERLNRLWELVVPAIVQHGGHANKFVGDGLLAVFGVPGQEADHAGRAVEAALQIARLVRQECGAEVSVGIGINSGVVVAGTVGGGGRFEFAVIGDAVNTAARVEEATRETGDEVLVTEATRKLLGESGLRLQERGSMALKGKQREVRLWAPTAPQARADESGEGSAPGAGLAPALD